MSRLGSPLMRRGQGTILEEALDGIERALGVTQAVSRGAPPRTQSGGAGVIPRSHSQLDSAALGALRERLGELEAASAPPSLEDLSCPPLSPCRAALIDAIGADSVFTCAEDRLRHATGRGYADLARLRQRAP